MKEKTNKQQTNNALVHSFLVLLKNKYISISVFLEALEIKTISFICLLILVE